MIDHAFLPFNVLCHSLTGLKEISCRNLHCKPLQTSLQIIKRTESILIEHVCNVVRERCISLWMKLNNNTSLTINRLIHNTSRISKWASTGTHRANFDKFSTGKLFQAKLGKSAKASKVVNFLKVLKLIDSNDPELIHYHQYAIKICEQHENFQIYCLRLPYNTGRVKQKEIS